MDNLGDLSSLGDLSAMLTPLLSDPETMNSLRQAAEQMGLGGLLPDSTQTSFGGEHNEDAHTEPEKASSGGVSSDLLSAVTRLAPLLSAPKEDDATRLLTALRPFLSQSRIHKLDEAERLLSLTRVLSILKESKLM